MITKFYINKNILDDANFQLGDSIKILIIGDSNIGLALNPHYIPESDNQFLIAEHYLFSYVRLKYFLKNNPQIDKVVLGFSYSNIAINYDERLFNSYQKNAAFPKYFMLLNDEETSLLYSADLIFFRNYFGWQLGVPTKDNIPLIFKTHKKVPYKKLLPFRAYGSYNINANYRTINYQEVYFHFNSQYPELSSLSIEYLYNIVNLCEEYDKKLILYASPLYPKYLELIPNYYINQFDSLSLELCKNKNISFISHIGIVMPDSCYNDGNHLSGFGAKIISEKFAEDLNDIK